VNWKIMKNFKFSSLLLVPLFAVLAACGGGGGDSSSTSSGTPTLKSIAVTIPVSTIPIGSSQS
jgi:ABC-type glycerol-3-phosphate transport system substrate-binding protein